MNRHLTALAASIALGGAGATGAFAATPSTLVTQAFGGTVPTAVFRGGATVNGGASFQSSIPASDAAGLVATLTPPASDVGKEADYYAVVNAGDAWYMRTPTGWASWNTQVASLVPFATKPLGAVDRLALADLEASTGIDFSGKTLRVHVGYQTDTSPLVYSSAIQFTMSAGPGSVCPADGSTPIAALPGGKPACVLSGNYTQNVHLTSNFDYVLSGGVFIGGDNVNSAALTIDGGTTIYGEKGLDFLVINRGSKIHVNGSASKPVVMTSANDASATATTSGQWGGLIINGNAPINGCTAGTALCEAVGEGGTGSYGGNNPADSSGNLNFLVVKYAGYLITPTNELNGIAFQGVGNGTNVDYVQVHNNADDGVEFFGGTVNAKHLFLSGNEDDSLDWTFGWTGKVQHVVIQQRDISDKAIEADNNATNRDSLPRAQPQIANMTVIGNPSAGGGILLREGTGANLSNVIVTRADKFCFSIDHDQTFANAGSSASALSGNLTVTNSVANCLLNFKDDTADKFKVTDWFGSQAGNSTADVGMASYINTAEANARPAATLGDSFFDAVSHIGAVKDAANDWTAGWTFKQ
ncbi:MAG TPA: hypothetical protein VGE69_05010 [Pseudomonadales bacterium]